MYQEFTERLHVLQCAACDVTFGITADYEKRRRSDHKGFMCPSGHSNVYKGESEEERLRRENARHVQNRAYLEDIIRQKEKRAEDEKKRSSAYRGQVTRIKNRVAAGVCPCCNRTFSNLARHMSTQHKEYKKETV